MIWKLSFELEQDKGDYYCFLSPVGMSQTLFPSWEKRWRWWRSTWTADWTGNAA